MSELTAIKILIAEDDADNAEIQKRFMQRISGVEIVGVAQSCRDITDFVEVFKPDLVLLDVNFPDGNGLDLLRTWRSDGRDLDVILITAASETNTLKDALRSGVFDYILKPLVFERLAEAIDRYRQHFKVLSAHNDIDQKELDRFMTVPQSDTHKSEALPKGIDLVTLDKVRDLIRQKSTLSADEAGKLLGVSRSTARRYLEYLISSGVLKVDLDYGHVGRPERRYISTA